MEGKTHPPSENLSEAESDEFEPQAEVPVLVPHATSEQSSSIGWRVFGSTLLCLAAIVATALWVKYSSDVKTVRSDVNQLREQSADLVREDEYHARKIAVASTITEVKSQSSVAYEYWRLKSLSQETQLRTLRQETDATIRDLEAQVRDLETRLSLLEQKAKASPQPKPSR